MHILYILLSSIKNSNLSTKMAWPYNINLELALNLKKVIISE